MGRQLKTVLKQIKAKERNCPHHGTSYNQRFGGTVQLQADHSERALGCQREQGKGQEYGNIETQPFDISKHRIIAYRKKDGEKKSAKSLSFTRLMNDIVSNYNNIVAKRNEFEYKKHDIEIFNKMMSFASEEEFVNSITVFVPQGDSFVGMKSVGITYNTFKPILKIDL